MRRYREEKTGEITIASGPNLHKQSTSRSLILGEAKKLLKHIVGVIVIRRINRTRIKRSELTLRWKGWRKVQYSINRLNDENHKMFKKLNDEDSPNRQEGSANDTKTTVYPSSSRTWSALRDPRVVRVSRALGGKDRHSKVSTIRGLRDRRVRLSVQTAIQLYDLQDRLGLNQPSKVVDWLLNAAQHEIDKLPPLQIPPEIFLHYPQSDMVHQSVISQQTPIVLNKSSSTRGLKDGQDHSLGLQFGKENPLYSNNIVGNTITVQEYDYWKSTNSLGSKLKEASRGETGEKINWSKRKDQENGEVDEGQSSQISQPGNTNNRFNPSSFSNILNNAFPFTSYYQLDTSNASFPHQGHEVTTQTGESNNPSSVSVPLPLPSSQLLLYPSSNIPSIFGQYMGNSTEFDPRQVNQFQMLNSPTQNMLSNSLPASLYSLNPTTRSFNINSKYDSSQHSNENPSASIPKRNVSPSNASSTSSFQNNCKDTLGKNPSFM